MKRKMGDKKNNGGNKYSDRLRKDRLLCERRPVRDHRRNIESLSQVRHCLMIMPIVSRI